MTDKKQAKVTVNTNWAIPWVAGYLFYLGFGGIERLSNLGELVVAYFVWPLLFGASLYYK